MAGAWPCMSQAFYIVQDIGKHFSVSGISVIIYHLLKFTEMACDLNLLMLCFSVPGVKSHLMLEWRFSDSQPRQVGGVVAEEVPGQWSSVPPRHIPAAQVGEQTASGLGFTLRRCTVSMSGPGASDLSGNDTTAWSRCLERSSKLSAFAVVLVSRIAVFGCCILFQSVKMLY